MTSTTPDNIETRLSAMTEWSGPDQRLWERALTANDHRRGMPILGRIRPRSKVIGAIAAVLLLATSLVVLGPLFSGQLGPVSAQLGSAPSYKGSDSSSDWTVVRDEFAVHGARGSGGLAGPTQSSGLTVAAPSPDPATDSTQRSVVRKATIELRAADVRAAYMIAMHVISEASGEFVQDSSLTGEDSTALATLTLRVSSSRLSEVLQQLRDLGTVLVDRSTGEDVTAQIVDLGARLRNEQRVEKELLELLEARDDAPLKEVLELRDQISAVRGRIESLTAQQQQLSRLVSLSTILVIIHADDAPAAKEESMVNFIGTSFSEAIHDGARTLVETSAGMVQVLLGGLVWWTLFLVVIAVAIRSFRRYVVMD